MCLDRQHPWSLSVKCQQHFQHIESLWGGYICKNILGNYFCIPRWEPGAPVKKSFTTRVEPGNQLCFSGPIVMGHSSSCCFLSHSFWNHQRHKCTERQVLTYILAFRKLWASLVCINRIFPIPFLLESLGVFLELLRINFLLSYFWNANWNLLPTWLCFHSHSMSPSPSGRTVPENCDQILTLNSN